MEYVGRIDRSKEFRLASFLTINGLKRGEVDFSPSSGDAHSSRICPAFSKTIGEHSVPVCVIYIEGFYALDNADEKDMDLIRDSFDRYGSSTESA